MPYSFIDRFVQEPTIAMLDGIAAAYSFWQEVELNEARIPLTERGVLPLSI